MGADQILTKAESMAATRDAAIATVISGQKAENVRRPSSPPLAPPSFFVSDEGNSEVKIAD